MMLMRTRPPGARPVHQWRTMLPECGRALFPVVKLGLATTCFGFSLALMASQTYLGVGMPASQNGDLPANAAPDDARATSVTTLRLMIFMVLLLCWTP